MDRRIIFMIVFWSALFAAYIIDLVYNVKRLIAQNKSRKQYATKLEQENKQYKEFIHSPAWKSIEDHTQGIYYGDLD